MRTVYVGDEHDQVLALWRLQEASSLRVLHMDFHCDMRGLLIDRRAGRAYRILDVHPELDHGSFLSYAVAEGRVSGIRWIHDDPGGRRSDVGTVKYESDLTALPHRCLALLRRDRGVPIDYSVVPYREWGGLQDGELLDIDWDFFASAAYGRDTIRRRVDGFLDSDLGPVPEEAYVCYSAGFCHASRDLFEEFARALADRFAAGVAGLPPADWSPAAGRRGRALVPRVVLGLGRRGYRGASMGLRRLGIY